jgi:hypothetical protein
MQEKAEEAEKDGAQDSASDGVAAVAECSDGVAAVASDGVAAVAECSAADGGGGSLLLALPTSAQVLSLLALLVQKYKYCLGGRRC